MLAPLFALALAACSGRAAAQGFTRPNEGECLTAGDTVDLVDLVSALEGTVACSEAASCRFNVRLPLHFHVANLNSSPQPARPCVGVQLAVALREQLPVVCVPEIRDHLAQSGSRAGALRDRLHHSVLSGLQDRDQHARLAAVRIGAVPVRHRAPGRPLVRRPAHRRHRRRVLLCAPPLFPLLRCGQHAQPTDLAGARRVVVVLCTSPRTSMAARAPPRRAQRCTSARHSVRRVPISVA